MELLHDYTVIVLCNSTVVLTASDHNGAGLAGDLPPTTTPGAWLCLSPTSKEKGKNGAALENPTTVTLAWRPMVISMLFMPS